MKNFFKLLKNKSAQPKNDKIKLIVGLGNPGTKYEKNRHNVGFILLEKLRQEKDFGEFEMKEKFQAEICEKMENSQKIILAKPQTFMNNSGQSVRKILDFYKIPLENLTVIHDDLDLEIGNFKISTDSRAAGHNGIQSIIDRVGSQKFTRIRIGVEKKGGRSERLESGRDFVLKDFEKDELSQIEDVFEKISF